MDVAPLSVTSSGTLVAVKTKRAQRIQTPSITLPFRDGEGRVYTADVWREDILEWHPAAELPSQFYLVLDFGQEEAIATNEIEASMDGIIQGEFVYFLTGRVQLDLQPIKIESPADWDLETGEGLGPPVARFADLPSELIGDQPGADPAVARPMVGWTPHPVSPRRGG